ncbi:MAG: phosphatase [Alphaproteobacteria bacterium]
MKTCQGDILALATLGHFDVIAHGCNCMCSMGRGLALQIAEQFPQALAVDRQTFAGDRAKLGTFTMAVCPNALGGTFHLLNAYTQYHWDEPKGEVMADYAAIRRCMAAIKTTYAGKRIGLPLIGAGLARGDWPTIQGIIAEELAGEDVTIVRYQP